MSDAVSSGVVDRRLSLTFCNCLLQVAAIFASCAGAYPHLIDKKHRKNIHVFQFLYYISSFFGLFGSHTTSFLLSAEVRYFLYAPALRSTCLLHAKLCCAACQPYLQSCTGHLLHRLLVTATHVILLLYQSDMRAAASILLKSCRLVHAVVAIPSGVVTCFMLTAVLPMT